MTFPVEPWISLEKAFDGLWGEREKIHGDEFLWRRWWFKAHYNKKQILTERLFFIEELGASMGFTVLHAFSLEKYFVGTISSEKI